MKHDQISYSISINLIHQRKRLKVVLSWVLLLAFLPLAAGCNYYRAEKVEETSEASITAIPNFKRYLVHQGENVWELKDVTVQEQALEGTLVPVTADLTAFTNPKPDKPNRYKLYNKDVALNLVHLYVYEYAEQADNRVSIPISAINRIDINDKDTGATIASHAITTVGALIGIWALISIIVILTKSSCPYVYVYNGNSFQFAGESYGGAIFSPLERHDYMPLPQIQANNKGFQIKLANELKERQFTNLAELLVVQHSNEVRVLLDQQGKPQTIGQLQAPVTAIASDNIDYKAQLAKTDSSSYVFDYAKAKVNHLELRFKKPAKSRTAKLMLHARNSLWLDYVYGEFIEQFGSFYTEWAEQQKDVPAEAHLKWQQEQAIPLKIEVETQSGWQMVEQVPTMGPLAGRDVVIPIDMKDVAGNHLKLRVSSGFMFWEIDQVGIDFSVNEPVTVHKVKATSAINNHGWDARRVLAADDNDYLKQFKVGEEVVLTYQVPNNTPGGVQSVFLHTKGYYEHIRDFNGFPNFLNLMAFKKPGHLTQFSRQRYLEIINSDHLKPLLYVHAPTN